MYFLSIDSAIYYTNQQQIIFSKNTKYDMKQEVTLNGLIDMKKMFSQTKDNNEGQ